MYDAIIVGARCAGASTALLLARQGHNVLLLDRATVPSDLPHGHFIHRGGPQRLQKWGVLDKIAAAGTPLVSDIVMAAGGVPMPGKGLFVDGVPFGCGPRRVVVDGVLVETAVSAGAELRQQFLVEELISDGGKITGIRGRNLSSGKRFTEHAHIVIGADGRNSRIANAVNAPMYDHVPSVSCYYFSYWSGVSGDALEVHVGCENIIFAFPTNDNLFAVFIAWRIEKFHEIRADVATHFMEALDIAPELAARVQAGHQEERFYGIADLPNFFRKPYGSGWALVGDAGHHKDPYMALGITDALRDADLVATAVHDGLTGRRPMPEALADFERERNQTSIPLFHENLARARFTPPPPEFAQIRDALLANGNQDDINQFLMANLGLLPREAFFNPQNIGRIMQQTAVA
ncbi:MAG: FAD-dependent monooxygenase [Anaerolineales bacterium]|nr:FAD-dependent monooxygenase [Anaerolineales bacterium]